ncbi:MAG: hypothetical protein ACOC8N_05770, partial [Spirochaetota bacterium]
MNRILLAAALLLAALVPAAAAAGQEGRAREPGGGGERDRSGETEGFSRFFLSPGQGACGTPGAQQMPVHPDPRVQALVERAQSLE